MNNAVLNCHHWGAQRRLPAGDKIFRQDTCSSCEADLHCSRNCRHFDPGMHDQCAEPQAEWVSGEEKSNVRDDFEPRTVVDLVRRSSAGLAAVGASFDSLFQK
jgi:hypothetical protein